MQFSFDILRHEKVAQVLKNDKRSFSHHYRRYKSQPPSIIQASKDARVILRELGNTRIAPAGTRTFANQYRRHTEELIARVQRCILPKDSTDQRPSKGKYRPPSVQELLNARSFRNTYRQRQLEYLKSYLYPRHKFYSTVIAGPDPTSKPSRSRNTLVTFSLLTTVAGALYLFGFEWTDNKVHHLNDETYVEYILKKIEKVSPSTSIFTLSPSVKSNANKSTKGVLEAEGPTDLDEFTPISSISIKDPRANIQRPYTILSHAPNGDLTFLIKRYDQGEVSKYIHAQPENATISIRKTDPEFTYLSSVEKDGEPRFKRIACIVGGTGIATTYQFLKYVLPRDEDVEIDILYASRSRDEIYLQDKLSALQREYGERVRIEYLVDEENTFIDTTRIQSILSGIRTRVISKQSRFWEFWKTPELEEEQPSKQRELERQLVLVCGSPGFVRYVSGEKPESGGQGQVGGLLAALGKTNDVVKL